MGNVDSKNREKLRDDVGQEFQGGIKESDRMMKNGKNMLKEKRKSLVVEVGY